MENTPWCRSRICLSVPALHLRLSPRSVLAGSMKPPSPSPTWRAAIGGERARRAAVRFAWAHAAGHGRFISMPCNPTQEEVWRWWSLSKKNRELPANIIWDFIPSNVYAGYCAQVTITLSVSVNQITLLNFSTSWNSSYLAPRLPQYTWHVFPHCKCCSCPQLTVDRGR